MAIIDQKRKELGIQAHPVANPESPKGIQKISGPFSEIAAMARQKLKELGVLEQYEAYERLPEEEKAKRKAGEENKRSGDLDSSLYDCPVCHNKGYTVEAEGTELVRYKCKCMATRRTIRRIKASGLEAAIDEYRFDNFTTEQPFQNDMKAKAIRFLEEKDKWFMICGQSGCGKTHICTAIVRQKIKHGHDVIYMPYRDEIVRIKQDITDGEAYQKRMEQLKQVDTLYIDDLYKGRIGEADINAMYELIGYRYNNHLTTIVSTEISVDRIIEIDQAIAGRIYERCGKGEYVIQIGADMAKNYRLR